MRGRSLLLLAATMALVLALLIGCGGGGGGQPRQEEEAAEQRERNPQPQQEEAAAGQGVLKTIQIEELDYELNPAKVTLEEPGTYVFVAKNTGQAPHALEIEGEGIEEETETIQPGQTARLKVDLKGGTYELYCPVGGHKQLGMEGKLTVKEG